MPPTPHRALIFACAMSVLSSRASAALSNQPAATDDAEALLRHGVELREKGDDEGALRDFVRANELATTGRSLAQLGLAEQALGRWVDAETHLGAALRHDGESWVERNRSFLKQAVDEIQQHLGTLSVEGGVLGADILINGQNVGVLPASPLRVPAGSVALEVRARGYLPVIRTVIVPAGGQSREQVALVVVAPAPTPIPSPISSPSFPIPTGTSPDHAASPPVTTPPAPPDGRTTSGGGGRRIAGASFAVAGGASLAVGIIAHVARESRAKHFNDGCAVTDGVVSGADDCQRRYDDVQSARNFAIGGYVGAAVLGGVGAFLLLSSSSPAVEPGRSVARAVDTIAWRCGPTLDRGVACAGRF